MVGISDVRRHRGQSQPRAAPFLYSRPDRRSRRSRARRKTPGRSSGHRCICGAIAGEARRPRRPRRADQRLACTLDGLQDGLEPGVHPQSFSRLVRRRTDSLKRSRDVGDPMTRAIVLSQPMGTRRGQHQEAPEGRGHALFWYSCGLGTDGS